MGVNDSVGKEEGDIEKEKQAGNKQVEWKDS